MASPDSKPAAKPKRYTFKAEIQQLLDILVHSVYTSKDIFIRELVSNASDALEKVRFAQVQGQDIFQPDAPLEIRVETREEDGRKVFAITDTGIGLTADEARENLGTIAHSGAASFLDRVKEAGEKVDLSLIGRFGIGFYSVFMVADEVVVTSRSAEPDAEPIVWRSKGAGSYTLRVAEGDTPRGTRIEATLKQDEERFAENLAITSTIRRYSNFVPFPIKVDGESVNQTRALWREQPSQVKDEDYDEFFKFLTFETEGPTVRLHFSADVPLQFSALLFVPRTNTEAMGFGEQEVSLQLYVKRVLIDGENKDLLPRYLRFVRGVVESEDLPLNISRETLQENKFVVKMRETLTRKLLGLLEGLARDKPEEYAGFWKSFGRILKEGYADFSNQDRVAELLRFDSSVHEGDDRLSGLADYVERMPEGHKAIYYLSGASRDALARDPRLEIFRKKGVEVLYLQEVADEFVLSSIGTFRDHPLVSADQVKPEDLTDLGEPSGEDETRDEALDIAPLISCFKTILAERVIDVRPSERLVDSAACLVNEEGMSGHMDKMLRLMKQDTELPKRILELNPQHSLIRHLERLVENDAADPFVSQACEQIFEGAMLLDGFLTDPHRLVHRMEQLLAQAAEHQTTPEHPQGSFSSWDLAAGAIGMRGAGSVESGAVWRSPGLDELELSSGTGRRGLRMSKPDASFWLWTHLPYAPVLGRRPVL